jgi:choice-of-anchor C domain-containing protein
MNRLAMLFFSSAALASVSFVQAANLVTNGSFEVPVTATNTTIAAGSSALTGWQISGTSGIDLVHDSVWQPSDGLQSISLNWVSPSTLTQTILTSPGQMYQLSFDMAAEAYGGPATRTMDVFWNGNLVESASFAYTGQPPSAMGWQNHFAMVVAGPGGSDMLQFVSTTPDNFGPALDNVALNAVPEPGTFVVWGGIILLDWVLGRCGRRLARPATVCGC